MKLLDEVRALAEIQSLIAETDAARLAVAFWGKGAIELLGLDRQGLSVQIICNLDSGSCNPFELRRLRSLPSIQLKSHPALHAKVYLTREGAVLGSSNASTNGLALDGEAAKGWREANVRIDGPDAISDMGDWFAGLFAEARNISDGDLDLAEQVWTERAKMAPTGKRLVQNLLVAFGNAPDHTAWQDVKVAFCKDDLDDEDEAWLQAELASGRLDSGILAYSHWNDRIRPNDWVLEFDVSKRKPRFEGIWRALPTEAERANMRLVYQKAHVHIPAFGRLTLSETDVASFAAITSSVLQAHSDDGGRNALIDLSTAVAMISTAPSMPNEKAFGQAMEQIYLDAVKIGYRPTTFRRMLANLGGVEAARRLIRGDATYGFTRLWEKKRLDLSVEVLILKPEWRALFTDEERAVARKRLKDYGFSFKE